MNQETETFAEKLVRLRKEANLSQEQLATKLYITRQTLSKWEKGESVPDMNHLLLLSEEFEMGLDELVLDIQTNDKELVKSKLVDIFKQDASDKDWHEKHRWREWQYAPINNGWEFLARYYWVVFALVGFIAWLGFRIFA